MFNITAAVTHQFHISSCRADSVITSLHGLAKQRIILKDKGISWQKCEPQTNAVTLSMGLTPVWKKKKKLDMNFPTKPLTQNYGDCLLHPDLLPTTEIRSFSHHMADDV